MIDFKGQNLFCLNYSANLFQYIMRNNNQIKNFHKQVPLSGSRPAQTKSGPIHVLKPFKHGSPG